MKFSKTEIDALACSPNQRDRLVFDDSLRGFGIRVTSAGEKIFLFQYRRGAAVKRYRIGVYGQDSAGRDGLTLAQARHEARIIAGQVAAGRDPVSEKAATLAAETAAASVRREAAAADAFTFAALITEWLDVALATASAAHRRDAPGALRKYFPRQQTRPAADICQAEIQAVLDTLATSAPVMARRALAYGRAAYNWAERRKKVRHNPFIGVALEGREASRDRVLTDSELALAWRAAGALGWPFGPLVQLLVLTLQRRSEVGGMRWSEIDQGRAVWIIPAARAKNGRAHEVHLAPAALAVLAGVPKVKGRDLIFTTTGKTPVSGFSKAAVLLRESVATQLAADIAAGRAQPSAAGGADWRFHDFRRTGVTVLARLGISETVADKILNHVSGKLSGVAGIYQRHEFLTERAAALDLWASHVLKVASDQAEQKNAKSFLPAPTNARPKSKKG